MRKIIVRGFVVLVAAYVAFVAALYAGQRSMLFPRDSTRLDTAAAGIPGLEETILVTQDGEKLVTWIVPPRDEKPVILFFPGNGGNLGSWGNRERVRELAEDGVGVIAASYRGYGGSTGSPSEEGLRLDARAAYDEGVKRFGAHRLMAYGASLGTGVAVRLGAETSLKAIILEAPYSSAAAIASLRYPFVPVSLLMKDPFRSDEIIHKVRAPLLVLHGEQDINNPFTQGVALFTAANSPRRLVRFPDGDHNNLLRHGLISQILIFVEDLEHGALVGTQTRSVRAAPSDSG